MCLETVVNKNERIVISQNHFTYLPGSETKLIKDKTYKLAYCGNQMRIKRDSASHFAGLSELNEHHIFTGQSGETYSLIGLNILIDKAHIQVHELS